jgi:hypothetical protein
MSSDIDEFYDFIRTIRAFAKNYPKIPSYIDAPTAFVYTLQCMISKYGIFGVFKKY